MKKNYLLFFLFLICLSISAQKNELALSFSKLKFKDHYILEDINSSLSVSYFRFISKNSAIGIKGSFQGDFSLNKEFKNSTRYYDSPLWNINADLVMRRGIKLSKVLNFNIEGGISALRSISGLNNGDYYFDIFSPISVPEYYPFAEPGSDKIIYLGFTSGIGLDIKLSKNLGVGINYNLSALRTNEVQLDDNTLIMKRLAFQSSVWF